MFLTGPSMDREKRRDHILGAFRNAGVVIRAENSIVEAALHLAVPRRCHRAYRNWYPVWIGDGYPLGARLSTQIPRLRSEDSDDRYDWPGLDPIVLSTRANLNYERDEWDARIQSANKAFDGITFDQKFVDHVRDECARLGYTPTFEKLVAVLRVCFAERYGDAGTLSGVRAQMRAQMRAQIARGRPRPFIIAGLNVESATLLCREICRGAHAARACDAAHAATCGIAFVVDVRTQYFLKIARRLPTTLEGPYSIRLKKIKDRWLFLNEFFSGVMAAQAARWAARSAPGELP